jgi:Fic-DOC domain mobile mystery protein B
MIFSDPIDKATPVDDISGLIPTHITNKDQLNEWEVNNIIKAAGKYLGRRKTRAITLEMIKNVHRDMFNETWQWAGQFRRVDLSIGIDWHKINEEVKKLADDIEYWENDKKSPTIFERSVRIHHRLVKIHPFKNGNGRHARMMSDIFLYSHGHKMPIWPSHELIIRTNIRDKYIGALAKADKNDYGPLEKLTRELIDNIK